MISPKPKTIPCEYKSTFSKISEMYRETKDRLQKQKEEFIELEKKINFTNFKLSVNENAKTERDEFIDQIEKLVQAVGKEMSRYHEENKNNLFGEKLGEALEIEWNQIFIQSCKKVKEYLVPLPLPVFECEICMDTYEETNVKLYFNFNFFFFKNFKPFHSFYKEM